MASKDQAKAKEPVNAARRGTTKLPEGAVRCWGEVGLTLPIPDLPIGVIRCLVGHERIVKSSSQTEIAKAFVLIDEANERELERRVKKYLRQFRRLLIEDPDIDTTGSEKKGGKSTAKERAAKQLAKGSKKGKDKK